MKKLKRLLLITALILAVLLLIEAALRLTGQLYLKKLYLNKDYARKGAYTNVICLGESSTAGFGVYHYASYPVRLEKKLRAEYPDKDIRVIVPPHVGQNTSQMANRIEGYLRLFKPKLVIIMAGFNNEWSLSESHINKFLPLNSFESFKIKTLVFLSNFRVFKMARYLYLACTDERTVITEGIGETLGKPELVRIPQEKYIYDFAKSHQEAFVELWRYDLKHIISACKKHNTKVLLMTYHINPTYLPAEEFVRLAREEHVPLARNDLIFAKFIAKGKLNRYVLFDNWHPNWKGYTEMAKYIFETIKNEKLLEEGTLKQPPPP